MTPRWSCAFDSSHLRAREHIHVPQTSCIKMRHDSSCIISSVVDLIKRQSETELTNKVAVFVFN